MTYTIVGLGNPGEEYNDTRHNVGRIVVTSFAKSQNADDFVFDKKAKALLSFVKVGKGKADLVLPETFMNKSGESVKYFVKNKKQAQTLVVIHDDLDIALGKFKISFNKSSGGHRGVESIIKAVKTQEFIRIRVGLSKSTASGKIRKPDGKEVLDFIIGKMKKPELDTLKKINKKINEALVCLINDGKDKMMSCYN